MAAAIDALEAAFAADALPRRRRGRTSRRRAGTLLVMPAHGAPGSGVKLVTLTPAKPGGACRSSTRVYVLFDAETQAPAARLDGAALTALRTGSGQRPRDAMLAREDAGGWCSTGPACRRARTWTRCGRSARWEVVDRLPVAGAREALVPTASAEGSASVGGPAPNATRTWSAPARRVATPVVTARPLRRAST